MLIKMPMAAVNSFHLHPIMGMSGKWLKRKVPTLALLINFHSPLSTTPNEYTFSYSLLRLRLYLCPRRTGTNLVADRDNVRTLRRHIQRFQREAEVQAQTRWKTFCHFKGPSKRFAIDFPTYFSSEHRNRNLDLVWDLHPRAVFRVERIRFRSKILAIF